MPRQRYIRTQTPKPIRNTTTQTNINTLTMPSVSPNLKQYIVHLNPKLNQEQVHKGSDLPYSKSPEGKVGQSPPRLLCSTMAMVDGVMINRISHNSQYNRKDHRHRLLV